MAGHGIGPGGSGPTFQEWFSTIVGSIPFAIPGDDSSLLQRIFAIDTAVQQLLALGSSASQTANKGGSSSSKGGGHSTGGGGGKNTIFAQTRNDDGTTTTTWSTSESLGETTPSQMQQIANQVDSFSEERVRNAKAYEAATGMAPERAVYNAINDISVGGGGIGSLEQLLLQLETAEVLGYFDDDTPTLAGRQFQFLMDSWFAEQIGFVTLPDGSQIPSLDRMQVISNLTGMMLGPDGPVRTLDGRQFDQLKKAAEFSEEIQSAGMVGFFRGERTVAGITLDEAIRSNSARETLTALGQLENVRANRAGEGLAREGNQIAAIGQQLAARARLGDLTLADAEQRRRSIDTAFTQRRAELVQASPFAVNPDDVFESESGQQLVELPLAGSIGSLLTLAGVPDVEEDFGTVPVFNTNPGAVGQGVLDASAFDSPVPGYAAALDAADAQFANLWSRPVHGEDVTSNTLLALLEERQESRVSATPTPPTSWRR